ncbi:MAG: potassium channel protein [Fimbriimonadaceae bacterium]|nr:potassium channel protein [Fimbriimonadaceae bacterium]
MKTPPLGLYQRRNRPFRTVPLALFSGVVIASCGYWLLGRAEGRGWELFDCVYFTVISVFTIGYAETLPGMDQIPIARAYTIGVLISSYALMLWASSTIIAVFVEGQVTELLSRRRMMRQIDALSDHFIVCGLGETGVHVARELTVTQRPVVGVENQRDRLEQAQRLGLDLFVEGDAEDESVLQSAGILRAAGFVACLPEDKDNVYLVLTARQINPQLRIVARATHQTSQDKLLRAGADVVVSPNLNGGMRMASEMIRPHVTTFLDAMLRQHDHPTRIEEVIIPNSSAVHQKSIGQVGVSRKTGLLILATRSPAGSWCFNPGPDHQLEDGMALVVLGEIEHVVRLRHLVRASAVPGR